MSAPPAVPARALESAPSSGVTIRFSQSEADIEARVALARRAWEEMDEPDLPFDEDIVRQGIGKRVGAPERHCLLQAELDGKVAGMLMGVIAHHYHSPAIGASVLSWYVLPERRGSTAAIKLLYGFRRWARERGAVRLYVQVSSGIDVSRTDRLLVRLGFRLRGGNYVSAL